MGVPPMTTENKPDRLVQFETNMEELKSYVADLKQRLQTLENYLPILERHFAGEMGGASEDANDAMASLAAAPAEDAQAAIEANAGAANVVVDPVEAKAAADVPNYMKE